MTIRRTSVLLPALAALLAAPAVHASAGDAYGALPRGVATVGTQTAAADDAAAAYYNPAGLGISAAKDGKAKVTLGYGAGVPLVSVVRDRQSAEAPVLPPWQGFLEGGAVFPLWGALKGKGALGLTLFHPQDKLIKVESLDPKVPHFLRYQSSPDRLVLAVGGGYQVGDFLSIGVGTHILAGLAGTADFDIGLFERRVEQRSISIDMRTMPAPSGGITVTPNKQWRLSIAGRGSMQLDVELPNVLKLGDLGTLELVIDGVMHYSPPQVAFGAQWQPLDDWTFLADVKAEFWGFAPNPAVAVDVKVTGEVAEGLGLDDALSFRTNDGPPGFQHVVVPSIAFEYVLPDGVSILRGGYLYRPTYVPDQDKATNWLDATTHNLGLGASFRFEDPTRTFSKPLSLDLGVQAQVLQPRKWRKSTGPEIGTNYEIGGVVLAASGAVRYEF